MVPLGLNSTIKANRDSKRGFYRMVKVDLIEWVTEGIFKGVAVALKENKALFTYRF